MEGEQYVGNIHLEIILPHVEGRPSNLNYGGFPIEGTRYIVKDKKNRSRELDVKWDGQRGIVAASLYNVSELQKEFIQGSTGSINITGVNDLFMLEIKVPAIYRTKIIGSKVTWIGPHYQYDGEFNEAIVDEKEEKYENLSIEDLFIELFYIDRDIMSASPYVLLNDFEQGTYKVISSKKLVKEIINYIASLRPRIY